MQTVNSLGKLQTPFDRCKDCDPAIRDLAQNILRRMAEIDGTSVTISSYRDLKPVEQDEPPNGDTFNELWDAVQDEICAAIA